MLLEAENDPEDERTLTIPDAVSTRGKKKKDPSTKEDASTDRRMIGKTSPHLQRLRFK